MFISSWMWLLPWQHVWEQDVITEWDAAMPRVTWRLLKSCITQWISFPRLNSLSLISNWFHNKEWFITQGAIIKYNVTHLSVCNWSSFTVQCRSGGPVNHLLLHHMLFHQHTHMEDVERSPGGYESSDWAKPVIPLFISTIRRPLCVSMDGGDMQHRFP